MNNQEKKKRAIEIIKGTAKKYSEYFILTSKDQEERDEIWDDIRALHFAIEVLEKEGQNE